MDVLLNYGLPPAHYDTNTFKLKEFLVNFDHNRYKLPILVNIVSLNNYGRSIKNILIKHTPLLLLEFDQLDSVIADYYGAQDERSSSQRSRSILSQKKMVSKSSTKFRNIKKLSKSVASLSAANQTGNPHDDDYPDDDDENAYNLRAFIKLLNEKRSSSVILCRIPTRYQSFFELLNGDDHPIEPYSKLADLSKTESEHDNAEKRQEKTPFAVFLRSSCNAYTKKSMPEYLRSPNTDQNSNLTVSVDSCYGSISDLDSQKNSIVLNESPEILPAGQTLLILDDCYALRTQISGKELKPTRPVPPSSSHFSPTTWMRSKSKLFSSRKHRQSNTTDNVSTENTHGNATFETFEHYVKCQTQQGDIVYMSTDEPGLFSPLNRATHDSKSKTRLHFIDTSDVFQLKDLLLHFRFPITVRLLDGPISFDNMYAPAVINRQDTSRLTPTKFRLLGSHNERIVFACPLNKVALKASKTSLSSIVLPLSVNADIEIQPCVNMNDILRNDGFRKLIAACSQLIQNYQTEITLVHFPLSLTIDANQGKEALYRKRSQSDSHTDYFDEDFQHQLSTSVEPFSERHHRRRRHSDDSSFITARSLQNRKSDETINQKSSLDTIEEHQQQAKKSSSYHVTNKDEKKNRTSRGTGNTFEDEIYQDVDKIYEFIRTGYPTEDVKKIQAKDKYYTSTQPSNSTTKKIDRQVSATCGSPGKMVTHRFPVKVEDSNLQFYPCEDEINVDNEQARALYLASKQRKQDGSQQDLSNVRPVTKMKKISRH